MYFRAFVIGVCIAGCIWSVSCASRDYERDRRRREYKKQYKVRYYHDKYDKDWIVYGEAGYLYGYDSYLVRTSYTQRNITPTICFSDEYRHANLSYYESFVCPSSKHADDAYQCCGPESLNEQYCCNEQGMILYIATRIAIVAIFIIAVTVTLRQCYQKNVLQVQAVFAKCCKKGANQNLDQANEMQPMNAPDATAHYPRQELPPAAAGDSSKGQGYPTQPYPAQGQGYPSQSYPAQGQGYPSEGYSAQGQGYPSQGYPAQGQGYPSQPYPAQGQGYPAQGQGPAPPAYNTVGDIKGDAVIS